jgi:hypothetical protein
MLAFDIAACLGEISIERDGLAYRPREIVVLNSPLPLFPVYFSILIYMVIGLLLFME